MRTRRTLAAAALPVLACAGAVLWWLRRRRSEQTPAEVAFPAKIATGDE